MRRCIYCLEDKDASAFDTEHVLNRAFGTYGNHTPTLQCVCQACNKYLGDEVDRVLARGTFEGLERLRRHVRIPHAEQMNELQRHICEIELDLPGRLDQALLRLVLSHDGEIKVEPLRQVGFRRANGLGWENFRLEHFMALEKPLLPRCDRFRILAANDREQMRALERIRELGLTSPGTQETIPPPGDEEVWVHVQWHIRSYIRRSIAKMALNYAAYTHGAEFVLKPCFDTVRRFIRQGEGECLDFVRVSLDCPDDSGTRDHCHFVTLQLRQNRDLVACISLFNTLTYTVRLTRAYPIWFRLAHGHCFDPEQGLVEPIVATSLAIPLFDKPVRGPSRRKIVRV